MTAKQFIDRIFESATLQEQDFNQKVSVRIPLQGEFKEVRMTGRVSADVERAVTRAAGLHTRTYNLEHFDFTVEVVDVNGKVTRFEMPEDLSEGWDRLWDLLEDKAIEVSNQMDALIGGQLDAYAENE